MKKITAAVSLCALCAAAGAQLISPDTVTIRSASGQFIVYGIHRTTPAAFSPNPGTSARSLHLEPALVAVSCERIKQALWHELDAKTSWRGKVVLALYPAQTAEEDVTIVSERFEDGWSYRVEFPDTVERLKFVRAVVQVLLLEYANRNAGERAAEIPVWLAEGLSQQLLASHETELLPEPTRWASNGRAIGRTVFDVRNPDPLAQARSRLRERAPLTLEELGSPAAEQFSGAAGEVYRGSAQLFVNELSRLDDGRACLCAMLGGLPQCYNWQTAFLRAFHAHFERQLDLEKWWTLQVVYFTGRDPSLAWTLEDSWRKLDEIVRTPVQVRASAAELPDRAEVSLQTIIQEWDALRQAQVLRSKLRDLELTHLRVARELAPLVDEYRRVLGAFLQAREQAGLVLPSDKRPNPALTAVVRGTLEQLDALETRRQALRPRQNQVSADSTEGSPTPAQ